MRRICSVLLSVCIVTSLFVPVCSLSVGAATYGYYTYEYDDRIGGIKITDCSSSASGILYLPDVIGGHPVTLIGDGAFRDCKNITQVVIPNTVTDIGRQAFYYCSKLLSINVPDSVTRIGKDAFYGTAWYDAQANGVVYAGKVAYKYKGTIPSNTALALRSDTKGIAEWAFYFGSNLISVTIPESVNFIGENAFNYCRDLSSVDFRARDCSTFSGISYPVGSISGVFGECPKLVNVSIGDSVKKIPKSLFKYCSSLTDVVISDSVQLIEEDAFYWCENLSAVTIGEGVTEIADSVFSHCTALSTVVLGSNVKSIGVYTFNGCAFSSIDLPDQLTTIKSRAFNSCELLETVKIPDSVTELGSEAFVDCTALRSISLGVGVKKLEDSVFYGCSQLSSALFSENLETIGKSAFFGCRSLAKLTLPASVTEIKNKAFADCQGLSEVTILESPAIAADAFSDQPIVFFGYRNTSIEEYAATKENYLFIDLEAEPRRGDLDSDGAVGAKDLTCFAKYLAAWGVEINLAAADFDGDGSVLASDLTRLAKHLAGWEVTLG